MSETQTEKPKFAIFRYSDASTLDESGYLTHQPFTEAQLEAAKFIQPRLRNGEEIRVLFSIPGFSLSYAWFKEGYPLPLHSHNSNCLYYIVAGTLQLGTQELGPRDGFFVPGDVPYAFTAGPQGVEIVEFRHDQFFDFKLHAKGEAYFKRAAETVEMLQGAWREAHKPALNV